MSDGEPESHAGEDGAQSPEKPQPAPRAGARRTIWETIATLAVAVLLSLLLRQFVVESFIVQGYSMVPNLQNGEHLLVNKFIYDLQPPSVGQIIIFLPPPAAHTTEDYVKRVIAVAGETVAVRGEQVYVNGHLQAEPYLPVAYRGGPDFPQEVVPRGDVFVLGDNRRISQDSRYFGFVPIRNIRGEAFFAWWPPQLAGSVG